MKKLWLYFFSVIFLFAQQTVTEDEFIQNYKRDNWKYINKFDKPFVVFTHKKKLQAILNYDINTRHAFIWKKMNTPFDFASDVLKKDYDIIMQAIQYDYRAFRYLADKLKHDRNLALKCVKINGFVISQLPKEFQNNKEFVIASVKQNPYVIQDTLLDKYKNNEEIGLLAIESNSYIYKDLSPALKNNKKIALKACEGADIYEYLPAVLKKDKAILFQCIKNFQWDMEKVDPMLKDDRNLMLRFIKYNGDFIRYASKRLRDDEEIAKYSLKKSPSNMKYLSQRLKGEKKIVLDAVKQNGLLLKLVSDTLKKDKDLIRLAVKNNPQSIEYMSDNLKSDKIFIYSLIENEILNTCIGNKKNNSKPLITHETAQCIREEHLRINFKNWIKGERNRLAIIIGMRSLSADNNFKTLDTKEQETIARSFGLKLLDDKDTVLNAVRKKGDFYLYVSDRLKNDIDVALETIKEPSHDVNFRDLNRKFKNSRTFVLKAVQINGRILKYAKQTFQDDKEIAIAAIKNFKLVYRVISKRLQEDQDIKKLFNSLPDPDPDSDDILW